MGRLKVSGKPFDISKREVWEAYEKVKANKGAPGVDGCSIDEFEKIVSTRRFRHGAHPLLKWCFGNAVVTRDAAGNRKLDKAKAYGRIDVAVAAVMAVGAMKASTPQVEIAAMIG